MTEPLTEQRPMPGPVVYGYLRLLRSAPARRHALRDALAEYCRQHELQLAGVFTDRGGEAAFAGLLDVLSAAGTYGVVLPALAHLGPSQVAPERARRITSVGARLLLVRGGRLAERRVLPVQRATRLATVSAFDARRA
ncbi:hypothetical protein [Nonomuraea roseola]|uniref:Recombinase family protein n=1 Tax=Nonomuraea roseola TaxID=46179 RepID=A0ABV5QG58_9ACTN